MAWFEQIPSLAWYDRVDYYVASMPSPGAVRDLAARRALFVYAHQDDEYGVFPVIEELALAGGTAVCLYLTSGAFAGVPSSLRNQESLAVLGRMRVAAEDVHFVGEAQHIADGQLHRHLEVAYNAASEIVARYPRFDNVYILAWEGGHQDHDAAHIVGLALAQSLGLLDGTRQFSLYNGFGLPWILFRVLAPLRENGPISTSPIPWRKRLSYAFRCRSYPSQLGTWVGLFPFMLIDLVFSGVQRLQPVSMERLHAKPHPGPMLYERRGFLSYERFQNAVAPFVGRHMRPAHQRPREVAT